MEEKAIPDAPARPVDARQSASDAKTKLEIRKIELEIALLKRPFWRSSGFVSLVITAIGVSVGFWTGFFDNQRIMLDITKANLERDVKDLARIRDTFLQETTAAIERDVELFLLKDLSQALHVPLFYRDERLSKEIYPHYFAQVPVPRAFLEEVYVHLRQLAWEPGYGLDDIQAARLSPPPTESGRPEEPAEFHSWMSLGTLLTGDESWLEAHALECTYDRTRSAVLFEDLKRLKARHKQDFIERFVRRFPPLQHQLAEIEERYGKGGRRPSSEMAEIGEHR